MTLSVDPQQFINLAIAEDKMTYPYYTMVYGIKVRKA